MDEDDTLPPELAGFGVRGGRGNNLVTLDGADLARHCPLDNGRHTPAPRHLLGRLNDLPPEVLVAVLLSLDLVSLTTFRRVNNRAMETVDSIAEYSRIVQHCPDVLRAVICLGATSYDCATLHRTLCQWRCRRCTSRFGSQIYLITCQRVCYYCYTEAIDYFPVEVEQAVAYTGGEASPLRGLLDTLPNVLSLPGKTGARIPLFDRWAVLRLMRAPLAWPRAFDPTGDFRRPEPRRLMTIISAPHFVRKGRGAHWGFYCAPCMAKGLLWTESRVKYTRAGLLAHIEGEHGEEVATGMASVWNSPFDLAIQ